MNNHHRLIATETVPDACGQIAQSVSWLGENDQLATGVALAGHQWVVEDTIQLAPFRVLPRAAQRLRLGFQRAKARYLSLQLGDGPGGSGLVDECVFGLLDFRLGSFPQRIVIRGAQDNIEVRREAGILPATTQPFLLEATLQAFAAAP